MSKAQKKVQARTKKKKANFLKAFEAKHGNVSLACKACGISRKTFYQWKNDDPEFAQDVKYSIENSIDFAESMLWEKIKAEYWPAIKFYLSTKGKHRGYSTKIETENTTEQKQIMIMELPDNGRDCQMQ